MVMTEAEVLLATVTHPAGFAVTVFAFLWLRPLEDGRYAVTFDGIDEIEQWEEIFDDPAAAVTYFIAYRNKHEWGADHETG